MQKCSGPKNSSGILARVCRFTDHHVKPVLIYTFQWETHARLTQAHLDAKTHKIIIRQSRQLDLRGKEPPPDALLLLRWLLNSPVGATRYEDLVEGGKDKKPGVRERGNEVTAERPKMVEVESA